MKYAGKLKKSLMKANPGRFSSLYNRFAGVVRELIYEHLEDEEDIRDGLKALQEKADTMDWATFKKEYLAKYSGL
jgi:hypothetical protein